MSASRALTFPGVDLQHTFQSRAGTGIVFLVHLPERFLDDEITCLRNRKPVINALTQFRELP